jgi:two-component system, cell cycle sensor histidine kinase and response regulator CckA
LRPAVHTQLRSVSLNAETILPEPPASPTDARYRLLFNRSPHAMWVYDVETLAFLDVNDAAVQQYGYAREEFLGLSMLDIRPPEQRPALLAVLQRLPANAKGAGTWKHRRKDGSLFDAQIVNQPVSWDGRAARLVVAEDVTQLRQVQEAALRASESHYRSLVQNAPYGIYRSTVDGRFLAVNRALVTMLGYASEDELLAADVGIDVYRDPEVRQRLIAEHKAAHSITNVEVEWKRKDGKTIPVRLSGRAVFSSPVGEPDGFEMIVEDVTSRRALEEQLRQAQKMEAVGQLAGGVAHDFGNLITAIMGYSDLVLRQLSSEDPRRDDVLEIKRTAERAGALTRQLLAYSRRQMLQPQVIDVSALVGEMAGMLRRLIGEDIQLVTVAREPAFAKADPGQLEQVVMNLALNARDAMPGGGRLTIETALVECDEIFARRHAGMAPGPYLLLAVTDTGTGMTAETQAHLFEPFFTTKNPGVGTGLGLATVYGIVKQSGGFISVYSEPGQGSAFKIYLPRVAEPATRRATPAVAAETAAGAETVLLVEDEAAVRIPSRAFLKANGYRVLDAANGEEALRLLEAQDGRPIHLLVTDVVMPRMKGQELAERFLARRPGTPVLFTSGYTHNSFGEEGTLVPGAFFLQKPFAPEELARRVREILDRGVGRP